jgi:hypothetical protein
MREQVRTHRAALIGLVVLALILSLAGLARGDVEAALIPWALPAAVLIGLWWEAHGERRQ